MSVQVAPGRQDLLVSEVFSAIQGEAALVGYRQVFLRTTGCNIRCSYCDQPEALEKRPGPCRIERTAGRRDWEVRPSPLPVADVADVVRRLWDTVPHHSVAVTGGEPLLQAGRLVGVLEALAGRGLPVMLETNGTLPGGLAVVAPWLTYVSMDLKLPSVDGEGVDPDVQRRFLEASVGAGLVTWAKIVLGPDTDEDELVAAVDLVAGVAGSAGPGGPDGPEVYLQPVTPFGRVLRAPTPDQVLHLHEVALRRYGAVRVVPQTHKAIGQL